MEYQETDNADIADNPICGDILRQTSRRQEETGSFRNMVLARDAVGFLDDNEDKNYNV